MKTLAALITSAALVAIAGCANWVVRSDDIEVFCGRERGTPYLLAPYPYYCTASVFHDAVCAPFRAFTNNSGPDGIADAIYTVTWPAWVVDDVMEVVFDTVFLPADAIYACVKPEPYRGSGAP